MKKWDKSLWWLLAMLGVFIGSVGSLFWLIQPDPVAETIETRHQLKLVFTVHDSDRLAYCNLFSYDTQTGQGALFDLPVTTGIWNRSLSRYRFLGDSYSAAQPEKFLKTLSAFADDLYPFYIDCSQEQLAQLIDLIGGVRVFLVDPLSVELDGEVRRLPAGSFTMQGFQALLYATQQLPGETQTEWIKRRQGMVVSVLSRLAPISRHFDTPLLRKRWMQSFRSNLSAQSMQTVLKVLESFDPERLQIQQLRGEFKKIDGLSFFLPQGEGSLFREQHRQITKALGDASFSRQELLLLNVEVLNGTKRNLLAANTTEYYQSYGYNVIATGNYYRSDLEKTMIVYHDRAWERAAVRVGEIINCNRIVFQHPQEAAPAEDDGARSGAQVSVILGADYEPFSCRKEGK